MHTRTNTGETVLTGMWTGTGWATFGGHKGFWWLIRAVEHYAPFDVSRAVEWYVGVGMATTARVGS